MSQFGLSLFSSNPLYIQLYQPDKNDFANVIIEVNFLCLFYELIRLNF